MLCKFEKFCSLKELSIFKEFILVEYYIIRIHYCNELKHDKMELRLFLCQLIPPNCLCNSYVHIDEFPN